MAAAASGSAAPHRVARIDAAAIVANVRAVHRHAGTPSIMVVVKADGYGHGALTAARAALAGGADWLGVADVDEALALRAAGVDAPLLAWLHDPDAHFGAAAAAHIDIGVSSVQQLQRVIATAPGAAVQVKLDTGLSRNGVAPEEWSDVFRLAAIAEGDGTLYVRGLFSHLANASDAEDAAAAARFAEARSKAQQAGLRPELTHLSASAASIRHDQSPYSMVRIGIAAYGLPPVSGGPPLTPAMTLTSRVAAVRRIQAGSAVSYDSTWRATAPTTLALVPVGYADGVPRSASNRAQVQLNGARRPVRGRIAMDQFVVDVGDDPVALGDQVVLFGDPATGAPGAADWARWAETIDYEIVTRLGPRIRREAASREPA
ncbi:alanine racemase [uncultured Amnibacterium sp.]|uniref:alanine racemase n=1 Tax=uncultured Amnibacterium sp. TaxID=1631851 RepID=UPI0035CA1DBF